MKIRSRELSKTVSNIENKQEFIFLRSFEKSCIFEGWYSCSHFPPIYSVWQFNLVFRMTDKAHWFSFPNNVWCVGWDHNGYQWIRLSQENTQGICSIAIGCLDRNRSKRKVAQPNIRKDWCFEVFILTFFLKNAKI